MSQPAEDELQDALGKFQAAQGTLDKLEAQLETLLASDFGGVVSAVHPLEGAKLNASVAYSLSSLYWLYLRAGGSDPMQHALKGELDRVKLAMKKIQEASTPAAGAGAAPTAAAGEVKAVGTGLVSGVPAPGEGGAAGGSARGQVQVDSVAARRHIKGSIEGASWREGRGEGKQAPGDSAMTDGPVGGEGGHQKKGGRKGAG